MPIGVDFDRIQGFASDQALPQEQERLRAVLGLRAEIIGLGVDRLDYTKGIPERLDALGTLMTRRPDLRGRMTFVQIGVPSRSDLKSYAAIEAEIGQRVVDLNARYGVPGGAPLVSTTPALGHSARGSVPARHFASSAPARRMNLVAKSSSPSGRYTAFWCSARRRRRAELEDAVIINPYDVDSFATALEQAIEMTRDEQATRMRTMRKIVAGRNVFNWASDILEGLESLWTKQLIYSVRGWEETSV